jgi:hypothetical protein
VRPHEALGMRTPATVWRPSPRRYDPHPPRWEYPFGAWVLKLDCHGQVDIQGRKWKVSKALSGERVQVVRIEHRMLVFYCTTLSRHHTQNCKGCLGTKCKGCIGTRHKEREGTGHPPALVMPAKSKRWSPRPPACIADASEIKSPGHPPNAVNQSRMLPDEFFEHLIMTALLTARYRSGLAQDCFSRHQSLDLTHEDRQGCVGLFRYFLNV